MSLEELESQEYEERDANLVQGKYYVECKKDT